MNGNKVAPWKEKRKESSEGTGGAPVRGRNAWAEDDRESMRPNMGSRASSAVGSRVGSGVGTRTGGGGGSKPQRTGSASSTRSAAETGTCCFISNYFSIGIDHDNDISSYNKYISVIKGF